MRLTRPTMVAEPGVLIEAGRHPVVEQENAPVVEALRAIEPDGLSPREALEALYRLKGMV